MAEQQKQQGKHQPAASDAPQSNVAQPNVPVEARIDRITAPQDPPTPAERAKMLVLDALALFDADEQTISKQVTSLVTSAVSNCPKGELVAFRTEGKLRAERLKQFSEMLFNEFIYQTATIK